MKKVSLLFGVHMHQPVDNFDEAVDRAVKLCYEPFFETMLRYPSFKFSLHCSGWLLETIKKRYPKLFDNMQTLTRQGSIEWFGGGYYEPVLSSIPSKDRAAQIKKLNTAIQKNFHTRPQGIWLTERVWDSTLAKNLHKIGVRYTMVDDYHFTSNGYDADRMNGYYITEEDGYELSLFPISKKLRYTLPFSSVENAVKTVLEYQKEENSAAIIFDDAEKFGLWPDTNEWVYGQKWLERFVQAVLDNEAIRLQHFSEYLKENKPLGLAYLDNCSYEEMGEWSLSAENALLLKEAKQKASFYTIKGGIWKNFFVKYHESNYLHKRMLQLSAKQKHFDKASKDALYRLQTNDVFWHGVFGGFYLPSLRDNAYRYLLSIEKKERKRDFERIDIDKDGYDELKVTTSALSVVISAKQGAQVVELGSLDALFNWQNCIMRREESYHEEILQAKTQEKPHDKEVIQTIHDKTAKIDPSLKEELIYDWHPKNSFIEHFSCDAFDLERFCKLNFKEAGDFANMPFRFKKRGFVRKGGIYINGEKHPSKLKKSYLIKDSTLFFSGKFKTTYDDRLHFAEEFNLHFAHPRSVTFNGETIEDGLSLHDIDELVIDDDFTKKRIVVKLNRKCDLFAYILNTISHSENGFEKIPQQISFIFSGSFISSLKLEITLEVHDV